jgi:hypothetical protein
MNELTEKLYHERLAAENILNNAHKELHQPHISEDHRKFDLLTVQAAIVQFELCSGLFQLLMTPMDCFASKVILKSLVHIIFEYRKSLKEHHIKTLMDLCDSKSFDSEKERLIQINKQYKKAINQLDQFRDLRKTATAHYDPDIAKQVSLIESINEDDSLNILKEFILFHKYVLESLFRVGRKR